MSAVSMPGEREAGHDGPSVLSLNNVAISRGGRRVVEGATLTVQSGEAIILKGANGSGKTSLLRAVAGLAPIDAGRIDLCLAGASLCSPSERRNHVAHCGHADAVKLQMSVSENLRFWSRLYGAGEDRAAEARRVFRLADLENIRAINLSAGQRRRLALARLVVSGKRIWVLDEPTSAMDAASTSKLVALLDDHLSGGGVAVIATHDSIAVRPARTFLLTANELQ